MDSQETDFRDAFCNEIMCNKIEDLNHNISSKNCLTVMHMNIQSVEANFHEFQVFLSTLQRKPTLSF